MSGEEGSGERAALPPAVARALGGRFRLERVLGRGAMGTVWQAHDARLGREVALKLLTAAGGSPERRARFEREARIVAGLSHPGIVRLHEAESAGDVPYLVLELVPGARPLDQVLPGLPLRERVRLLRDAARALGHAHAQGVVHRDVKPSNVLVDGAGRLKVVDFGLAAAAGDERLTRTGALVGTPFWAAPEQLHGQRELGPAADVWSLGVLLYEALTGRLPFPAETFPELVMRVTTRAPEPLDPGLAPELAAVCLRALARLPEDRYPQGDALADDLEAWLSGAPVSASASTVGPGLRRLRRATLLGLPLLAALLLPLGLVAWGPGSPPAAAPPAGTAPAATPRAVVPGTREDPLARRRLDELRATRDPGERRRLAEAWLREFRGQPAQGEVRRLQEEAELAAPLRRFQHAACEARAAWLDPRSAISWGLDGRLVQWDLGRDPPQELRVWIPCEGAPLIGAAASAGRVLVATHDDKLSWVTLGLTEPNRVPGLFELGGVECLTQWRGADGDNWWAVGTSARGVWLHRQERHKVATPPRTLPTGGAIVRQVAFSGDGARLVVASGDGRVHQGRVLVWDRDRGELLHERTFLDTASSLAVSPDGGSFAMGTSLGRVLFGRIDPAEPMDELRAGADGPRAFPGTPAVAHSVQSPVTGVAFTPDGRRLWSLSEGAPGVRPSELKLWDLETRRELRRATLREPARGLSLSPDGRRLLIATLGGELQEWRAE